METKSSNFREAFLGGAIYGAAVWMAYAIAEHWFASILPWVIKPHGTSHILHRGFSALLLFFIYPALGGVMGGVAGLLLNRMNRKKGTAEDADSDRLLPIVTTLTVPFIFVLNFTQHYSFQPVTFLLIVTALLPAFALIMSVRSYDAYKRFRFLYNPLAVSIVLLSLPWIVKEMLSGRSMLFKGGSCLLLVASVFALSFAAYRTAGKGGRKRPASVQSPSPKRGFAVLIVIAAVSYGATLFLYQEPSRFNPDLSMAYQNMGNPNVVLITMDTVRADHLSLYGYKRDTTPNLEKLAKSSIVYSNVVASTDMTLSTHASIFTGMYASQHGAHYDPDTYPGGKPLSEKALTLAEVLAEENYFTLAVVSNHGFLGRAFLLDQGFGFYDDRMCAPPFLGETKPYFIRQGVRNLLTHWASPFDFDKVYRNAEEINQEAFTLLDGVAKTRRPFFLFLNYMDAHWPYIPPPPFDSRFAGKAARFTSSRYYALEKKVNKLEYQLTDEERRHLTSQYDGGIAYIDFHLDKLLARLKKLGLYENSLIIITSDHGEAFGERDLMGHGVSVYQDQVSIPLIVKYPDEDLGSTVADKVSVVDLMPTVLDVMEMPVPEGVKGVSLRKLDALEPRFLISESFPNGGLYGWHPRFHRVERALFSGPYKFILSTAGKRELYDLLRDPGEKENLLSVGHVQSKALEAKLTRWLQGLDKVEHAPAPLDREVLDRLKALGYVQ